MITVLPLLLPGGCLSTTALRSMKLVKGLLGSCEQICLFMSPNSLTLRWRMVLQRGSKQQFWFTPLGARSQPRQWGDTRWAGTQPSGLVLLVPCWEAAQLTYAPLKYWPQSSPIWANWQGSPVCKEGGEMQREPEQEPEGNFSRWSVLHQVRSCRYFSYDGLHVTFSTIHHRFTDELHRLV